MGYSEARKKYAREWYAKNRERLLSCPIRRAAKNERQNKAYEKKKLLMLIYAQILRLGYPEKYKEQRKVQYQKHRPERLLKNKEKRKTEGYKEYVSEYRKKNRKKINYQQRITSRRSIEKAVNNLTDSYIVGQILCSPNNTLSRKELYNNKDLIEQKRVEILIFRINKQIKNNGKENCRPTRSSL